MRGVFSVSSAAASLEHWLCSVQHSDKSVLNSPASFSTSIVIGQQPDTFSSLLHNTMLAQIPLQWPIQLLIFLMSYLMTLYAPQCSSKYSPFDRYIHSSSFTFMLQTLWSSKSFRDLHAQLAFESHSLAGILLKSLGADTHMLENIFIV